jgi:hypothetical protein
MRASFATAPATVPAARDYNSTFPHFTRPAQHPRTITRAPASPTSSRAIHSPFAELRAAQTADVCCADLWQRILVPGSTDPAHPARRPALTDRTVLIAGPCVRPVVHTGGWRSCRDLRAVPIRQGWIASGDDVPGPLTRPTILRFGRRHGTCPVVNDTRCSADGLARWQLSDHVRRHPTTIMSPTSMRAERSVWAAVRLERPRLCRRALVLPRPFLGRGICQTTA